MGAPRRVHRIVSLLVLFVACGVVAIALVRQPATSSVAAVARSGSRPPSAAATPTLPRKASLASGPSVTPHHPVYLPFVPNVASMAPLAPCPIQSIVPYSPQSNSGFVPNDGTFLDGQNLSSEPDMNGYYQIFSTHAGNKMCLTCNPPANAPTIDRFKRFPMWVTTPQGNFIQFTAEDPNGPIIQNKNNSISGPDQIHLNNGYWSNIWAMNQAGNQWYQLTSYPSTSGDYAVLAPLASPNGAHVAWSEMYHPPDPVPPQTTPTPVGNTVETYHPEGRWDLWTADFSVQNGIPSLQNVTKRTRTDGTLYEVQSWSPDSAQVAMSADIGIPSQYGWDTFLLDVANGQFTDVSNQPLQWEEHAKFSPSGRKIAFATSYPFPSLIQQYGLDSYTSYLMLLRMEFFVMDSDGSNWGQLSYFNSPPPNSLHPEYNPNALSVANVPVWSTDGTMLLVGQEINTNPASGYFTGNQQWLITFTAPCQ